MNNNNHSGLKLLRVGAGQLTQKPTHPQTQLITNKWKEHVSIDDLRVRWDLLKFEIQSASMSYSKIKAKARRERESLLLSKIESLDKKNNQ